MTPEERAELRRLAEAALASSDETSESWPLTVLALTDALDAAEARVGELLGPAVDRAPAPENDYQRGWNDGWNNGWNLAHSSATCGHARANWKDPLYGTPKYRGDERCECCAAIEAVEVRVARLRNALGPIVAFCDDPHGSDQRETLARGLAGMLPKARVVLAETKPEGKP